MFLIVDRGIVTNVTSHFFESCVGLAQITPGSSKKLVILVMSCQVSRGWMYAFSRVVSIFLHAIKQ